MKLVVDILEFVCWNLYANASVLVESGQASKKVKDDFIIFWFMMFMD